MKKRFQMLFVYVCTLCCFLMVGCESEKTDQEIQTDRLTETLNELYPDENWAVSGHMAVDRSIQTFQDPDGNEIRFYTCQAREMTGQVTDEDFYGCVVDLLEMETAETRQVGDHDAMLYTGGGRAYLCWRPAQDHVLILDYDPETLTEAEILLMAESARKEGSDADG